MSTLMCTHCFLTTKGTRGHCKETLTNVLHVHFVSDWTLGTMGTKTQSLSLRNLQAVVKEKLRTHLDPEKYGQCNDGAKHGGCGKQEGT